MLLTCPRDGTVLTSCSKMISAYQCTTCKGLLVELDKSKSAPLRKLDEFDILGESSLSCPVNGTPMTRMKMFEVEVDVSFESRLVWFDYNEYEILTSRWLAESEYKPKKRIPDAGGAPEFILSRIYNEIRKIYFGSY